MPRNSKLLLLDKDQAESILEPEDDIVITTTPGTGALFSLEAVQSGTHLNCVGAATSPLIIGPSVLSRNE